ncbi:restriction endonuclease [Cohnella sp. SGD-V74]|uniref:restriction endonuclease n=1 Tax=unclassified Cohnella TaxID=2636738 RepID=UPI000D494093|nr:MULTISPECIES: restriction endonuclease [unclassified Cohnella]PRX62862.1 restriction endonuclease [Cohnella sp. SGD-V74]
MDIRTIYISFAVTLIIFLVLKYQQFVKEQKLLIDRLKKSHAILKQIEVTSYFKGQGAISYDDVREVEINRIMRELGSEIYFRKIGISHVRKAIYELIDEFNGTLIKNRNYIEKTELIDIDKLEGLQFEQFLRKFFEKQGFKVTLTPGTGDQGVDLVLMNGNRKIAVQAKRYSQHIKVGNSAIQEVYTGKQFYSCNEACVITTSTFTNQAVTLANKVGVKLVNRKELKRLLDGDLKI